MNSRQIVIGLTGQMNAGKGAVVDILRQEFDFGCFSLSDRVREVAASRGAPNAARTVLQDTGNEMRRTFGGDIFARLTAGFAFVRGSERIVIDGIRNPVEVKFLREHAGFHLIALTASREKRFEWMLRRARVDDPKTYDAFLVVDDRDLGVSEDPLGQQVGRCIEIADVVIDNNGTLNDLTILVRRYLETIGVRN